MNRLQISLLLVLSAAMSLCIADTAAQTDTEGFVTLFDGKSLDGWKVFAKPEGFKIENGLLRSMAGTGAQVIYYDKEQFGDFVLRVEWRVSAGGNSGVFFRTPQVNNPWEVGYEVQILSYQPPLDDLHCTGALYGYVAPTPRPDETPDKWRTYEITAKGPLITVKLDGKQLISYDQSKDPKTKDKPLKGYFGLQDSHGPEGTRIEYRSVKIKKL